MHKQLIIFLLVISTAFFATKPGKLDYPKHFPTPIYNFENNPLSEAKKTLGRALFYDPILSKDSTISCASCHSPYNAFAHTDHDLSHGINDQIGTRNAPALFNLAWQNTFMWDGAHNHLDMQALAPMEHPGEMAETLENIVRKLQNKKIYPPLFQKAFNDSIVTGEHLLKALAQFQLSLISANSKYDQVIKGDTTFTEQEQKGYALFQKHCSSCHVEPMFTNFDFVNNGLPIDTSLNDYGRWAITKKAEDGLKFKVPTLRNLTYTFPYMHDGRFKKLNQVLSHYTNPKHQSKTLANELKSPLKISSNEKVDLIAFLLTLNDKEFVFNREHQFPRDILMVGSGK